MNKRILVLLCVLSFLTLGACGSMPLTSAKHPALQRSDMTLQVSAAKKLNIAKDKTSSPVLVKVYQLKDTDAFNNASFKDLWQRDIGVLGFSLLRQTQFMVKPGASENIDVKRNNSARFLGVVAIFKNKEGGQWRAIKELRGNRMKIKLMDNNIKIG